MRSRPRSIAYPAHPPERDSPEPGGRLPPFGLERRDVLRPAPLVVRGVCRSLRPSPFLPLHEEHHAAASRRGRLSGSDGDQGGRLSPSPIATPARPGSSLAPGRQGPGIEVGRRSTTNFFRAAPRRPHVRRPRFFAGVRGRQHPDPRATGARAHRAALLEAAVQENQRSLGLLTEAAGSPRPRHPTRKLVIPGVAESGKRGRGQASASATAHGALTSRGPASCPRRSHLH